jgi:membrane-associated protease RseP (regulator of RpoE activity)
LLLLGTVATTFGSHYVLFADPAEGRTARVLSALAFSLSLVFILGVHEMGHYLLARRHGVDVSLPYFIPVPFGMGTLGAVIRMRSPIPSKDALLDIGAAGPLAGAAVAIPVFALGLWKAKLLHVPLTEGVDVSGWAMLQRLAHLAGAWVNHQPLGGAHEGPSQTAFGDNLLSLGLQRVLVGRLAPGWDVSANPFILSGWFGLLVTMLNLLPVGQLDGGHVAYAVLGERARWLGRGVAVGLLGLALFLSAGWFLWFLVGAVLVGTRHPPVVASSPLSPGRRWVALASLVLLVLCFMPIPLRDL